MFLERDILKRMEIRKDKYQRAELRFKKTVGLLLIPNPILSPSSTYFPTYPKSFDSFI
jgi:hypothetical protein